MQLNGRIELLAWNSAAALVGAAVMFAVLRSAIHEPAQFGRSATATVPQAVPGADRMGFVKPGAVGLRPTIAPELRPSLSPPAGNLSLENAAFGPAHEASPGLAPHGRVTDGAPTAAGPAAAWATETKSEAAQPGARFQVLPSLRLPWQTAKPGTPRSPTTLKARLEELSPGADIRLAAKFEAAKAAWPPAEVALVALKDQRVVELHARPKDGHWKLVHRYQVLAASGHAGPKLLQGDRQVPEGVYGIASLNPNSAYHVSLRVNYPNAFDRQMATRDGRKGLGGDIMIHGKNLSAGCLAMGDEAAEELFVLAARVGLPNVKLVIAPTDFREAGVPPLAPGAPDWVPRLYAEIASAMAPFQGPPKSNGLLSYFSK